MTKKTPRHIGIIPDGNRRWAVGKGMQKQDGYEYGLNPGLSLLHMARENGIEEITYYGFTVDNCKRPAEQFQAAKQPFISLAVLPRKPSAARFS